MYNGQGNASANPVWVSCSGGAYTLYIQSPNNFGGLTINWGDSTANTTVASLISPAFISHTYAAAIANYTVTITESGAGGCVITGLVVMEEPVNASIQIPMGGVTQTCAPDNLIFTNSSTDASSNTTFIWNFGDGSPTETYGDTNAGQTISHTYEQGTVNCVTTVTLSAQNYCSFGNPTVASFNPIQIFDIDDAAITADYTLLCYPDTVVHFSNTTAKNCVPQGNTAQRFEYWNFGDYWGQGTDSIVDWAPFDPPAKPGHDIAFPGVGTYIIMMADSNMCGADTAFITIQVTDAPVADFSMSTDSSCTGDPVSFVRLNSGANAHLINYGDGGGYQSFGATSNHTYTTSGNYTITVVANVGGGSPSCTDTAFKSIEILPSPTANATISPSGGCDSVIAVFINTSGGGTNYLWQFGNGDTSTLANPPPVTFVTTGQHIVTLTVTSNNGCIDSTTASVEVYDTPEANFGTFNVCEEAQATFIDSSSVGYGGPVNGWLWSFGDTANSSSTMQNPTFTYQDSGVYTVWLVASSSYCSDTAFDTILVEPRPTAIFQESDSNGCSPLSVTFTNQSIYGSTYEWSFGDGSTSNLMSPVYTFTNPGQSDTFFVVKLVVYSAFGCADSVLDTIVVRGNPIADFTSDAILDCAPLVVNFSDSSSGAVSWDWDFDDGFGSTASDPTHIFNNQTQFITNYTITLTITGSNGCVDSAFQSITVYPEPLFGFSIVPDSGCSPLNVQFPVAIGAVLYSWDFGDNTTSTGANPSHVYVNNSTNNQEFTVTLIATSAFGCMDTVVGIVTVFPKPNAALTPAISSGCQPLSVVFTNGSTGGNSYHWDFDDGTQLTSSNVNETHVFANNSNDTILRQPQVIAITDKGCADTASVNVFIYRKIEASFSVNEVGCHPFNASFNDNSINPATWDWDFDDGYVSSVQNPSHVFLNTSVNPMLRTVELVVESIEGCTDDTTILVTINPKPSANFIISSSPACHDEMVSIENISTQNSHNVWRFSNSGIPVEKNSSTIDTAFQNTGSNPRSFNIFLVVENSYGCRDSMDKEMRVFPRVVAEFISLDEGCSPFDVSFTNLSSGGNLFEWDFDDGNISFMDEPDHTFIASGTVDEVFTVKLTVTSPYGCEHKDSFDILVHPTPVPVFTVNPISQRYPDTTVSITNLTGSGPWVYSWNYGDGHTAITQTPVSHSYGTWGEYRIILEASSDFCEDTASRMVIIEPPLPIADFDLGIDDCAPVTVEIDNNSKYGVSFFWEFGDGATSSSENPIYTYQFPGTYTLKLTVIGPGGESDFKEISKAVTVRSQPIANFIYSPNQVSVPNPVLFINYSQFADRYEWDFGDSTYSNEMNPQKIYLRGGQYYPTLIALTEFGCSDTFQNSVPIVAIEIGEIEVPNAFTPSTTGSNGGMFDPFSTSNSVFFPVLTGVASDEYILSIFNRWGELLFETTDVNQGWDGYYRGKACPQDVYVWKLKGQYINGQKFSRVGDVTLIK